MHTYESSPSDLLHAYLDGELDSIQEAVLFRQLADSEELRSALRELLSLRSLVQNDRDILLPSSTLRRNILLAVQTPQKQSGKIFGLLGWNTMRTTAVLLCVAMAGGALSFGITRFLDKPYNPSVLVPVPTPTASTIPENNQETEPASHHKAAVPAIQNYERRHKLSARALGTKNLFNRTISSSEETGNPVTLTFAADMPVAAIRPVQNHPVLSSFPTLPAYSLSDMAANPASVSDVGTVQLHLRGYTSRSYPAPSLSPQSDPWFRNIAVGLSSPLFLHHRIGIEIGQESFSQVFRGSEGSRKIRYEQNPLLFWYGVSYRYTMVPLEKASGIRPYIAAIAGATRVGPLGRATIGMEYMPDRRVALSFGLEGSLLGYRFQNAWNTSQKLGLTYEMSILF